MKDSDPRPELIKRLIKHYGKDWKTPLAKQFQVNVTTVRRLFNREKRLPPVWVWGVKGFLISQDKK